MIRINLLPPEFRVKERTPLPMLFAIMGSLVLCVLVLLVFLYFHMVWLPKVDNDLKEAVFEKDAKAKKVLEYESLVKQQMKFQSLDRTVKDIEAQKDFWGRYLKDLVTIFADCEKENENLRVWMSDLSFNAPQDSASRPGQSADGGAINFNGDIAGSDFSLYSTFIEEMLKTKEDRVLPARVDHLGEIRLKVTERQGYIPDKSVSYPFDIFLKAKAPETAPPPPGQPGAAGAQQPSAAGAGAQGQPPGGAQAQPGDQKKSN